MFPNHRKGKLELNNKDIYFKGLRNKNLWASSNRITDFLWVEVIIDKPINDGRELRFHQSIAGSYKVRQDGTQSSTNL